MCLTPDTRYNKFGPDIGQLQKCADPVQVGRITRSLIRHMHLKDYDGGTNYAGYCPLGTGGRNIPPDLHAVEKRRDER